MGRGEFPGRETKEARAMARKYWAGIDLGKSYHKVAVIDERQALAIVPFRIGRGRAGVEKLFGAIKSLGGRPSELAVAIEATGRLLVGAGGDTPGSRLLCVSDSSKESTRSS